MSKIAKLSSHQEKRIKKRQRQDPLNLQSVNLAKTNSNERHSIDLLGFLDFAPCESSENESSDDDD
jgi:hypothetical protein